MKAVATSRQPVYLAMDTAGEVLASSADPFEVLDVASEGGRRSVQALLPRESDRDANPPDPRKALRLAGLSPLSFEEVFSLEIREAWGRVRAWFDELARMQSLPHLIGRREKVRAPTLQSLVKPGGRLLAENAKLHKRDPRTGVFAVALGLSLLPESSVWNGRTAGGVDLQRLRGVLATGPLVAPRPRTNAINTLCAGSSAACRASCLVYSGQNQSDARNNLVKAARAQALLSDPAAFMRLLCEAIERYGATPARAYTGPGGRRQTRRFVRLNVFSDVPWEEMTPWLFPWGTERGVEFYDYTKVPGRFSSALYDLTFSYSGVNLRRCGEALAAGMRVAMVFHAPTYRSKAATMKLLGIPPSAPEQEKAEAWLLRNALPGAVFDPELGPQAVPVVDGDRSDIRPLDPPGVIVGLRFKPPHQKGGPLPERFVVQGLVVESSEGPAYILPETPLSRPMAEQEPGLYLSGKGA